MPTLALRSTRAAEPVLQLDWRSRLVVGTDGTTSADWAVVAACRLAGASPFGVVSVLPDSESAEANASAALDVARDRVVAQLERVLGASADVWMALRRGSAPAVLASFAEVHQVALLIVGIGHPSVRDRLLGDEYTLRLARMTKTPVLAVAPGRPTPPRRIVVAMDFSATSMRAARLALAVAAPDAEVLLAHVTTPTGRDAPAGAMRRMVEGLQTGFCGRVSAVNLTGDAGTEILGLANALSADAIAVGTQGTAPSRNGVTGPVATRVIRCSSCSLLIAPGGP